MRVVGVLGKAARKCYEAVAGEFLYMEATASLTERPSVLEIVRQTDRQAFVPMTVGGGFRNFEDISAILRAGDDKAAPPAYICEVAQTIGYQCIVGSIDGQKMPDGKWEPYTDSGRESTVVDVVA